MVESEMVGRGVHDVGQERGRKRERERRKRI